MIPTPERPLPRRPAPRLGDQLGRGGYKTAYEHPDDPTKVILISNHRDDESKFIEEVKLLNQMHAWGLPAIHHHDLYMGDNGRAVLITDRHYAGRGGAQGSYQEQYSRVTLQSVRTANQMARAARRHCITGIGDFQYLWAADGSIVINDPNVHVNFCTEDEWVHNNYSDKVMWYTQLLGFVELAWAHKSKLVDASTYTNCREDHALFAEHVWTHGYAWLKDPNHGKKILAARRQKARDAEAQAAREAACWGIPTVNYKWIERADAA